MHKVSGLGFRVSGEFFCEKVLSVVGITWVVSPEIMSGAGRHTGYTLQPRPECTANFARGGTQSSGSRRTAG